MIKHKKIVILCFSIALISSIVVVHNLYRKNRNLIKPESSSLSNNDNHKIEYTFKKINALNNLPKKNKITPSIMGFTQNNYFFENNELSDNLIYLSKVLFKYDFKKDELTKLMDIKKDIKVIGVTQLDNTLLICYLDMSNWSKGQPFTYVISKYTKGKELILLKTKYNSDTFYPNFILIKNKIYFLLPDMNYDKEDFSNAKVNMTLYEFDGQKLSKVYRIDSYIKNSIIDSNIPFILDNRLHFNGQNKVLFQEFSSNSAILHILEKDKISNIKIDSKFSLVEVIGDNVLLYNKENKKFYFYNFVVNKYNKLEESDNLYEAININDQYICALKENGRHYLFTPSSKKAILLKTPIRDYNLQREFIFTDGHNVLLQVSNLENNEAEFYQVIFK